MDKPLYPIPKAEFQPITDIAHDETLHREGDNIMSRTSKWMLELADSEKADIISDLRSLGFKEIAYGGNGSSRTVFLTNGAFVLAIEHIGTAQPRRACTPSMLQPLCEPFTIDHFRFEVLPYTLPMDKSHSSQNPINSGDELREVLTSKGFHYHYSRHTPSNCGLLLTGHQLYIDPGVIERKSIDIGEETTLNEFWNADLSDPDLDPLVRAQHQHLTELNKQLHERGQPPVKYGEWPRALKLSPEKIKSCIQEALTEHQSERDSGARPTLPCTTIRRIVARDPMQVTDPQTLKAGSKETRL